MSFALKNAKSHKEIEKIYGILPKKPVHLYAEINTEDHGFAAGLALKREQTLTAELEKKSVTIPFTSVIPKSHTSCPAIINLGYESHVPNKYLPAEEIIERGYAIFALDCSKISEINDDFNSGIYKKVCGSRSKKNATGKLMLWAWAAVRLMEYAKEIDNIDSGRIAVSGHGTLAESALLSATIEDGFSSVILNGLFNVGKMVNAPSYLFSADYIASPSHSALCLVDLCNGKRLAIGSATNSVCTTSELADGLIGLILKGKELYQKTEYPKEGKTVVRTKNIQLHTRVGDDYFSRRDWISCLDFLDQK